MQDVGTRHLDLGCGNAPRNPFLASKVYGVDIRQFFPAVGYEDATIIEANLLERMPFEDSHFSSISAYDVLEHIPRWSTNGDGSVAFPFVELMNEVWRLLGCGGTFIASTPAFPHPKAFQDPTHVNIITKDTHSYFTGAEPYARRYGFKGHFEVIRAGWDAEKNAQDPLQANIRKRIRNLEHRLRRGGHSHITWFFKAQK
jgi:SAM-dependent methyltransferase